MAALSSLAYKDLRGYLEAADKLGELRVVNGADWDLEIGAITEMAARATNPKVVLFDSIKGYPKGFRVVTNPVCSAATTALAFGLDPKLAGLDLIRAWKEKLGSQRALKPVAVSNGPITENVDCGDKVDLLKFPTPRWHEHDGGRYIGTGCMVIMEDPDGNGPMSVLTACACTTKIRLGFGSRPVSMAGSSAKNTGCKANPAPS